MAIYSGESVAVQVKLEDYLGNPLIGGDLTSVVGEVFDGETSVVEEFDFVYSDAGGASWVGEFDTDGVDSGNYKLKVTVTAIDGSQNWEYSTINLRP